jgi:hypothetical protein
VPVFDGNAQVLTKIAETIAGDTRKYLPAQPDSTKLFAIQVQTAGVQLMLQKRIVEIDIVRNENTVLQPFIDDRRYLFEKWGAGNHLIGNTGERLHIPGNGLTGMDQGLIALNLPIPIM